MITVGQLRKALAECNVPDEYFCYAYEGHEGTGIVLCENAQSRVRKPSPSREVFIETGDFFDLRRPIVTDATF
jgi:hypothetical protein